MIGAILSIKRFLNPKRLLLGVGFVVASTVLWNVWGFVDQAMEDRQRVVQQNLQLELRQSEIDTLQTRLDQAERAYEISKEAQDAAEAREEQLRRIRDTALQTGSDDDGPIAPVLGETLRALRGDSSP